MNLSPRALRSQLTRWRFNARLAQVKAAGLRIGEGVEFFGPVTWGSEPWLIEIGDETWFSAHVAFINHDPGTRVWRNIAGSTHLNRYGPIRIGRNCLIGYGVIILPNVEIGDNCVVGAGSVVSRDIPSGSVAAGSPARVVSTIEAYGAKVERETLLELGHEPADLWRAVWQRFDESRAARRE